MVKVSEGEEAYACKVIRSESSFLIRRLERFYYPNMLRQIPTKFGEPFVETDDECLQVTRWIDPTPSRYAYEKEEAMLVSLADLHHRSKVLEFGSKEWLTARYAKWEENREWFGEVVRELEEVIYYSPFQLNVLMQAPFIEQLMHHAIEELNAVLDQEDTISTCIVHGAPTYEHFILSGDGSGYWIALSSSYFGAAPLDLAVLCREIALHDPYSEHSLAPIVGAYSRINEFMPAEWRLFIAELLYPIPLIRIMTNYVKEAETIAAVKWERALAAQKRLMMLAELISAEQSEMRNKTEAEREG
ncbi:hypothetical protein [Paenalkalicoccus suaedae]|uniref:hypothetical protein n=1 Tax=Paenalkalicoccus suaedae TaxID=2592382 RepID=UPI00158CB99E|nr:hypothetical protein [Paenalkalicoccus suaedae]